MRINTLHTGQIRVHQEQELWIHKTKAPNTQVSGYQNQGTRLPPSLRPNYKGIKVHQSQLLSIHKTKTPSIQVSWCTRNKDSGYYEEPIIQVFGCTRANDSGYTRNLSCFHRVSRFLLLCAGPWFPVTRN